MMIATENRADVARALVSDERYTLPDGSELRFVVEPDYHTSISDFDCYGKIALVGRRDYPVRPDGFDGFARKVWIGGDCYWWQPPDDLRTATRERARVMDADGVIHVHPDAYIDPVRSAERCVRDLIEYGFQSVGIQHWKTCDACGTSSQIDASWIGGVEPFADPDHLRELAHDLLGWLDL